MDYNEMVIDTMCKITGFDKKRMILFLSDACNDEHEKELSNIFSLEEMNQIEKAIKKISLKLTGVENERKQTVQ